MRRVSLVLAGYLLASPVWAGPLIDLAAAEHPVDEVMLVAHDWGAIITYFNTP